MDLYFSLLVGSKSSLYYISLIKYYLGGPDVCALVMQQTRWVKIYFYQGKFVFAISPLINTCFKFLFAIISISKF